MIKRSRRESTTTETQRPSPKVVSSLAQHAVAGEVADIESFRTQETVRQRVARYANRVILGSNATSGTRSSLKPDRYDVHGYQQHLSAAIETSVRANNGQLGNELYEVAEQAGAFLSTPGGRGYHSRYNTPKGAENLSVVRAVTHNPAFISTDSSRAASILASLGEAGHSVTYDMFTDSPGVGWRGRAMNAGYANTQDAVPAIAALVHEDALWSAEPNKFGHQGFKARGALAAISEALGVLSERSPLTTIDARLEMLARNQGDAHEAIVDYNLVYSFRTDVEQDQLRAVAANEQTPDTTRGVAQAVLDGDWNGVAWAI